jgi:drug/metabolite transporter (DMT)-like permease
VVLLLALGAAAAYGLSDFLAGVLTRRGALFAIAVVSQSAAAGVVAAAAVARPGDLRPGALAFGALAGLGNAAGCVFLYRGLGRGRMAVVAPLSALVTAGVPVLAGVATGERPGLLPALGLLLALPAIWLVSVAGPGLRGAARTDLVDGIAAGVGFGLQFTALGQVGRQGGLAPLALCQGVTVLSIVVAATFAGVPWLPRDAPSRRAVGPGLLAGVATIWFQLAVQRGLLSVASVVAALYPAVTILLATVVLRERLGRTQGAGLALAAAAVALIAAG